jgi:hypothetical protein
MRYLIESKSKSTNCWPILIDVTLLASEVIANYRNERP